MATRRQHAAALQATLQRRFRGVLMMSAAICSPEAFPQEGPADPEPWRGLPNQGPCPTPPNRRFYRGDSNSDCGLDIVDGIYTLNHLFLGGPAPTCMDAADANDSGTVNLSDAVYLLAYLFFAGPPPPPPQPPALNPDGPAEDPTCDGLPRCEGPLCQ